MSTPPPPPAPDPSSLGTAPPEPVAMRLPLDASEQQHSARLRLAASLVATVAGVWLALVSTHQVQMAFALAALLFGVLFARRYRAAVSVLATAGRHFLELGDEHLTIASDQRAQQVRWSEIAAVEIDEDRLLVVLRMHEGKNLDIEPHYGGLPLRALAERLHQAHTAWGGSRKLDAQA